MHTATVLLVVIGLLGAFDVAYFHTYRGQLTTRPCARREAWIHVARSFVYAAQFLVVPNLRLSGRWYFALLALFALDIVIAVADVREEPHARAEQGGLSGGEYAMHMLLSVLVGALLLSVAEHSWGWRGEATALRLEAHGPTWLRVLAALMAGGCFVLGCVEALVLHARLWQTPEPLHIRVRLHTSIEQLWNVTQDHRLHPRWDHRFSRIEMVHEREQGAHDAALGTPDPRIGTGTLMRYERDLGGLTVRGFGRYKLHRPLRQSTFEFWSDDPRSLITRGVGLWLYRQVSEHEVELSTSFTYRVRWGIAGRVIDRLVFRPLFERLTARSFRRLSRLMNEPGAPVSRGRARREARTMAACPTQTTSSWDCDHPASAHASGR